MNTTTTPTLIIRDALLSNGKAMVAENRDIGVVLTHGNSPPLAGRATAGRLVILLAVDEDHDEVYVESLGSELMSETMTVARELLDNLIAQLAEAGN